MKDFEDTYEGHLKADVQDMLDTFKSINPNHKPYGSEGEIPFNFGKPARVASRDDIQLLMPEDLQKAVFGKPMEMSDAEYQKHVDRLDAEWAKHLDEIKDLL